jgi:hypothetical protein
MEFVAATMKRFASNTLLFTTELYQGNTAPARDWWYYAFDTGQHISFFQRRTLEAMARKLNLRFVSMHGLHVFTERSLKHEALARLLTARAAAPFALHIRNRLGSRTLRDHHARMEAGR